MSLIKQLWLGIIVLLMLALGGSLVISFLSANQYLREQLQLKNLDNAQSLALSLSQIEKEPVTLELLVAAQFDTGHYEFIRLVDPKGQVLIERVSDIETPKDIPAWFAQLTDLQVQPGIAQVQDGWQQYGTLTLASHRRFANESLWQSTLQLLQWFFIAAVVAGLIGTWILQYISRPLDMVVQQAEAIGERRFITSQEPKTQEFQRLVRAMNRLSGSVKSMLEKETQQLEMLRRESQLDPLTGLFNRVHFLNLVDAQLTQEDSDNSGSLFILRVLNLAELNNRLGRAAMDKLLCQIGAILQTFAARYQPSFSGRLNGSDFALLIAGHTAAESLSQEISHSIHGQLAEQAPQIIALPIAACRYHTGENRSELLHRLDGALAQAELKGDNAVITLPSDSKICVHRNINEWREAIDSALQAQKLELASFPVKTSNSDILHFEAPVRLLLDNQLQPAGYFVPWAARLGLMPAIDLEVIKTALHQLSFLLTPLAINVSAEALCNLRFREQAMALLRAEPDKARDLWLEFSETCALRHPAEFRSFCHSLRELGCRLGLEHVGLEFTRIGELQDVGLSFLKIDTALIRDIDTNTGNQHFVQGLCKIGHSLGMVIIAEGVKTEGEKAVLFKLGADAITGPGV